MSSIIVGVAGIGSGCEFGRLGLKTLVYYLTTTFFTVMVGLLIVNLVQPGIVNGEAAKHLVNLSGNTDDVIAMPSASLVAIAIILTAVGLPVEAIGLILAVDRVLDMCRTSIHIYSDSCGAVIIARLNGEKNVYGKLIG